MLIEVKVPQLSESVAEATLLTWNKKVGDAVSEGENLIDIETDKVVLELPAIKSGVLSKIIKTEGSKVGSGEIIAQIDTEAVAAAAPAVVSAAVVKEEKPEGKGAHATPSARKLAHELEVNTAVV